MLLYNIILICIILIIIFLCIYLNKIIKRNNLINSMSKTPNKWIIVLTTCVKVKRNNEYNINDINERIKLYIEQINKWIKYTMFDIFVVESSGYNFNELEKNPRLHIYTFIQPDNITSSTQGEINSLLYLYSQIKDTDIYNKCTHIFKVTGRYYLENIQNILLNTISGLDLYLQKRRSINFQNTEYFGIKKELFYDFISTIPNNVLLEYYLHKYKKNKIYIRLEQFQNNIRRGGDNLLLNPL
jgi:hypothetical protein